MVYTHRTKMETKRKMEEVEIALCELYDLLYAEGEKARANEVARMSRTISKWR